MRRSLLCAILLLARGAFAAAQPASRPANIDPGLWSRMLEVDAKAGKVLDLTASFEQRKITAMLKKPLISSGRIYVRGPVLLWKTEKPEPTAVQITDQGIVAGSNPSPGPQSQINDAMAKAGYPQVSLTPSTVKTGEDGSFSATTGVLQVVHRDEKLGAQNPQGFQGGGFSVGGAEVSVLASRCAPSCGGALDLSAPPVAHGGSAFDAGPPGHGSGYGSSYGGSSSTGSSSSSAGDLSSANRTEAVSPSAPAPPESSTAAPPATSSQQQAPPSAPQSNPARPNTLAATQLPPSVAGWMRDAFLAFGAALLILLLSGTLLIRSR